MDNAKAAILIIIILLCDFNFLLFVNAINKPNSEATNLSTIVSTELINSENFATSDINNFINRCTAQGLTEITIRGRAFNEFLSETLSTAYAVKYVAIINAAYLAGITVNFDLHTWYTTWDNYFRDSAPNAAANRAHMLAYITDVITKLDSSNVKAFMVLNEPQDREASTSENNFILDCISTAKAATDKPISVRFMSSGSPTSGDYDPAIDTACDFICRNAYWVSAKNTYWDARSDGNPGEAVMLAAVSAAHGAGKEFWLTEFGSKSTDTSEQQSYVAAMVDWAVANSLDRVYCWASSPTASEGYNLFSGSTPKPAWYELVSSGATPPAGIIHPQIAMGVYALMRKR